MKHAVNLRLLFRSEPRAVAPVRNSVIEAVQKFVEMTSSVQFHKPPDLFFFILILARGWRCSDLNKWNPMPSDLHVA